ncbi:hypothetical protein TRVL_07005 [Trypanosoma vivax]|nr:hypothetical protein TRVL_07005 [Trypanosoma vivax]
MHNAPQLNYYSLPNKHIKWETQQLPAQDAHKLSKSMQMCSAPKSTINFTGGSSSRRAHYQVGLILRERDPSFTPTGRSNWATVYACYKGIVFLMLDGTRTW